MTRGENSRFYTEAKFRGWSVHRVPILNALPSPSHTLVRFMYVVIFIRKPVVPGAELHVSEDQLTGRQKLRARSLIWQLSGLW